MKTQTRLSREALRLLAFLTTISITAAVSASTVLLNETFNNGTPSTSIAGAFTSDGKGTWTLGAGDPGSYGGTPGNPNYHPQHNGLMYMILNFNEGTVDLDQVPHYIVDIGTITLGGWSAASSVLLSTRKTSTTLGYGYDLRPNSGFPTFWNVYYQGEQGTSAVFVGTIDGSAPTVENLQIRVWEDKMRLYVNGIPFDPYLRPTQGSAGSGAPQRALEVSLNALPTDWIEAAIDDITIYIPAEQEPFVDTPSGTTLVYEGFNYDAETELNSTTPGGFGWIGDYTREQTAALAVLNSDSVIAGAPGFEHGDLIVEGNRAVITPLGGDAPHNARRSIRWIDMDNFPAHLRSGDGTLIRATGEQLWLSVLAQKVAETDAGFFGVSLFSNAVETVFLGKGGNQGFWKVEGKSPNTSGNTAANASELALLVVCFEWNHDGTLNEVNRPVNPDKMYLWVNPNLNSEPNKEEATLSTRDVIATTNDPYLHFNRVGFRGNAGGEVDEFRIGTTFRSVAPILQLDPPELSISRVGTSVTLRWKTTDGFVLQSAGTLSAPVWANVTETVTIEGDESVVTVTASDATKFFRLAK